MVVPYPRIPIRSSHGEKPGRAVGLGANWTLVHETNGHRFVADQDGAGLAVRDTVCVPRKVYKVQEWGPEDKPGL